MKMLWCWRCQLEMPMLDEAEWAEVMAAHNRSVAKPQSGVTQRHQPAPAVGRGAEVSAPAYAARFIDVLDAYERITGFRETNPAAIWHHRVAQYGPPCAACGKPLRTPRARMCAACGASRTEASPPAA
jgi:hypothetical protein